MIRVILMEVLRRKFDIGVGTFLLRTDSCFVAFCANNGVEAMEGWAYC
jgi:hypothetical protein